MLTNRIHILRQRLRTPSAEPARAWMRRDWWKLSLLGIAVVGVVVLNVWLMTCGFYGCPTRSEIRAYRPTEGGRILDQNGGKIGNLAIVRRINVPIDKLERFLTKLPKDKEVVAYCRGPYCLMSYDAVEKLRKHGWRARRLEDGFPEWRAAGLPVRHGAEP